MVPSWSWRWFLCNVAMMTWHNTSFNSSLPQLWRKSGGELRTGNGYVVRVGAVYHVRNGNGVEWIECYAKALSNRTRREIQNPDQTGSSNGWNGVYEWVEGMNEWKEKDVMRWEFYCRFWRKSFSLGIHNMLNHLPKKLFYSLFIRNLWRFSRMRWECESYLTWKGMNREFRSFCGLSIDELFY